MIADRTIKYTRNDKVMAFLSLEDLVGNMEIVVFPRDYERYGSMLVEEARVFIKGRASMEEEKDGKLICERIYSFAEAKRELWLQFETAEQFKEKEQQLYEMLHDSDGEDGVVIYISAIKAMKRLGSSHNICIGGDIVNNLTNFLGKNNVKVVEKSIEKNA